MSVVFFLENLPNPVSRVIVKTRNDVQELLGFAVRRFAIIFHAHCLHGFLYCCFIFTKWGIAWDEGIIDNEIEWHYHESNKVDNQDNMSFTQ